jgi:hypothetical protein
MKHVVFRKGERVMDYWAYEAKLWGVEQPFKHGTVNGAVSFRIENKALYANEMVIVVRLTGDLPDDARFGAIHVYDHSSPDERDECHWVKRARGVTVERAVARVLSRAYVHARTPDIRRLAGEFAAMTTLTPHQL